MASIKLAPPWVTLANEITQLFLYDPEVHVVYDNENHKVSLYVDNANKATALTNLLPAERTFGNITVNIEVIPANGFGTMVLNPWAVAFTGNGAFSFMDVVTGIFQNDLTYLVFKNKVVQYYNDDLGDIYGQCSTLYQEIAKDIFGQVPGVYFCTDKPDEGLKADNSSPSWP